MTREEMAEVLWVSAEKKLFVTRDAFMRDLEKWELEEVVVNGETAFIFTTLGEEFHYMSLGRAGMPMGRFCEKLKSIISKHGVVRSRTPLGDERQRSFNEKVLGAAVTKVDDFDVHYAMTSLPEKLEKRLCR